MLRRALILAAFLLLVLPAVAGCLLPDSTEPRTLVLALDGVPFRVMQAARQQGAFQDWPETVPLVSTFPSLTNVAFTYLFGSFGVEPAGGYEIKHFDWERNRMVGGSLFGYDDRLFAWRDTFDVTGRTARGKLFAYTRPGKHSRKQLRQAGVAVMESESDLVLAHVGATDALQHLRGDAAVVRFLLEVDSSMDELRQRHLAERGRPLRLVLLSDHGNTDVKVRPVKGVRKSLRRAGLRPVARLRRPGDVVARSFGVVSYGALFVEKAQAASAAQAVAGLRGVDFAAWVARDDMVQVVSVGGEARIHGRVQNGRRRYAYEAEAGDPLRFADIVARMREAGTLDADGYAEPEDWLRASAGADFPDALRRVVEALGADHLLNHATVIFSTKPGYAWGLRSAHLSSRLAGGRLEGTHGGLDRESSLAFFLTDDAGLVADPFDLGTALGSFAELGSCVHREHSARRPTADAEAQRR